MIEILSVQYKNFGSVGNTPITIALNTHRSTLIQGSNGAGKTTFLDAIVFALYGKSFRSINKDELINSTNKTGALVQLEFRVGQKSFRVVRGIKPNIFEIYEEGFLLDANSGTRDLQSYLEQTIIKIPYKTFIQIIILGSSFIPFLKLSAGGRREFTDTVLDLTVYTEMSKVLKSRHDLANRELGRIDNELRNLNTRIEGCDNMIATLVRNNESRNEEITEELKEIKNKVIRLQESMPTLPEFDEQRERTATTKYASMSSKLSVLESDLAKLLSTSDVCDSCGRPMDEEHIKDRAEKIDVLNKKVDELKKAKEFANEICVGLIRQRDEFNATRAKIKAIEAEINVLVRSGLDLSQKRKALGSNDQHLEQERHKRLQLIAEKSEQETKRAETSHKIKLMEDAITILHEKGIRSQILKIYLNRFVELVNEYLTQFSFDGVFTMNAEFKESIVTRGIPRYYESYSMGERLRIDLAILFAWRKIIINRNAAHCNILALDEILDASLDGAGTSDLSMILDAFGPEENVFVVTHRANEYENFFERVLTFTKQNGFTLLSNSTDV